MRFLKILMSCRLPAWNKDKLSNRYSAELADGKKDRNLMLGKSLIKYVPCLTCWLIRLVISEDNIYFCNFSDSFVLFSTLWEGEVNKLLYIEKLRQQCSKKKVCVFFKVPFFHPSQIVLYYKFLLFSTWYFPIKFCRFISWVTEIFIGL